MTSFVSKGVNKAGVAADRVPRGFGPPDQNR